MADGQPSHGSLPDDRTLAAIVAAVEVAWPRVAADAGQPVQQESRWRFSNRWWSRKVPARRVRPWA